MNGADRQLDLDALEMSLELERHAYRELAATCRNQDPDTCTDAGARLIARAVVYAQERTQALTMTFAQARQALDGWLAPQVRGFLQARDDLSLLMLVAEGRPMQVPDVWVKHPWVGHKDREAACELVESVPASAWWVLMGFSATQLATGNALGARHWCFTRDGVLACDAATVNSLVYRLRTPYERTLAR